MSDEETPVPPVPPSRSSMDEARSRGGKQKIRKNQKHAQKRGSLTTPTGASWLQLRKDWETGAFTVADLAHAYGVNAKTIRYRMQTEAWPDRPLGPTVARALPGLVEASLPDGAKDSETIEATIAILEGRSADPDEVLKEKGAAVARRKALVLRDHREFTARYRGLFLAAVECLEDYSNGVIRRSFVRGKNADGSEVVLSFNLFSRQSGFIDVVDKVGGVLERTIRLERLANGLEGFDGTGERRPGAGESGAPMDLYRGKTNDELASMLTTMVASFDEPHRQSRGAPVA